MSDGNWIKIHRKMLENPVCMKDADHLAIWTWLLMKVCWCPKDVMFGGERITLEPGQWTTGRKAIASELHISESKVYRVLKRFESEQLIEQRTDHQCTLVTILNWDKYQNSEQENEQQVNNERTTSEQRVNTNKEYKNNKKGKNIYTDVPEDIKDEFMEWAYMREKKKKPLLTKRAVTLALNKLNSLTKNTDKQKELINYAIYRNWESFYPIPESDKIPKKKEEPKEERRIEAVAMPQETREKMNALGFGNLIGKE